MDWLRGGSSDWCDRIGMAVASCLAVRFATAGEPASSASKAERSFGVVATRFTFSPVHLDPSPEAAETDVADGSAAIHPVKILDHSEKYDSGRWPGIPIERTID